MSSLAQQLAAAAAAAPGVRVGVAGSATASKGRPSLLFHSREAEDVDGRTVLALARSGGCQLALLARGRAGARAVFMTQAWRSSRLLTLETLAPPPPRSSRGALRAAACLSGRRCLTTRLARPAALRAHTGVSHAVVIQSCSVDRATMSASTAAAVDARCVALLRVLRPHFLSRAAPKVSRESRCGVRVRVIS